MIIDLRSDTVTQPTAEMRRVMAAAQVGDDVIDADPTVAELQQVTAELLGKEAALFMPSGTMCNLVAVRLHCQPGDELICDAGCHIYQYEQGGYAQINGVAIQPLTTQGGCPTIEQLDDAIRPSNDHMPRTALVTVENTHNRGGGRVIPLEQIEAVGRWTEDHAVVLHLDGARLFNASVASGTSPSRFSAAFDTVSVCFSKGLGAPVGSALAGPRELISRAVRHRKVLGGAMRQSGIIAAAALFALQHHVERLAEDHHAAQCLARAIEQSPWLKLCSREVDTNIVIFELNEQLGPTAQFCQTLKEMGVWILPFGGRSVRAVTHLDVTLDQVRLAGSLICQTAEQHAKASVTR